MDINNLAIDVKDICGTCGGTGLDGMNMVCEDCVGRGWLSKREIRIGELVPGILEAIKDDIMAEVADFVQKSHKYWNHSNKL